MSVSFLERRLIKILILILVLDVLTAGVVVTTPGKWESICTSGEKQVQMWPPQKTLDGSPSESLTHCARDEYIMHWVLYGLLKNVWELRKIFSRTCTCNICFKDVCLHYTLLHKVPWNVSVVTNIYDAMSRMTQLLCLHWLCCPTFAQLQSKSIPNLKAQYIRKM